MSRIGCRSDRASASRQQARSSARAASRSAARLSGYLAAGLGATGLVTVECEAEVVNIDVTSLGLTIGANAGVSNGQTHTVSNFLLTGRSFGVSNQFLVAYSGEAASIDDFYSGFMNGIGVSFAAGGTADAQRLTSPTKFLEGSTVGSSARWDSASNATPFRLDRFIDRIDYDPYNVLYESNNFSLAPPNFIGFRVAANGTGSDYSNATQFHYGYFQVTWDKTADEFRILSGAYESTVNTPITVVPEPTGMALAGIGALAMGAGAIRRTRKARKAAAEAASAELV